ncbi:MAG: beta-lactamase family protein [Gammaproteobacteria bacterium]|nr:beta-lactamase family protein [Gammaproteobacteria bacterium]NNL51319.1 beta-lactamase family protein [Woeseiaceae bacterium]
MNLIKGTKWILIIIAALVVMAAVTVIAMQVPIPAAGTADSGNSRIYEQSYEGAIATVHDELDGYRATLVSPSISVAVGVGGELVWADARGYANIESQILATPDTVYAVGSVSKPLTAVLTALLWQDGQLDIDVDVRGYVPNFPAKEHSITLRQLLSHQAGIRHYRFGWKPPVFSESMLNRKFTDMDESLFLFAHDALLFEPDTDFNYSTFGYTLVAAAIERVTGQSYINALEERILEPLSMQHTSIDQAEYITGARATDYVGTFSKKAVVRAPATNSSYKWAGGGLVSTPTDLVRFGNAMIDSELLREPIRTAVFTARELPSGELNPQHYGLGWRIGGLVVSDEATDEEKIIKLIHHAGTRAGSTAILMIVPDHNIVVAMTSNTVGRGASGPLTSVAAKVAREFIRFEADR